ncbi:reverse transcriptase [Gossypium australe]|uniref:Reverse transcriptase n=1 Tax=Gossypium australe TaxID=47621 RepID=A0A5B6VX96_9ROSI|nr:reverse transcriptase [Gossypium australe]
MSKAYDCIKWNFLENVMKNLGFEDFWVDKIMRCVLSVRYVVKCNMVLSEVIAFERGLQQGNPLSPYLFLFCIKAFSRMLLHAQAKALKNGFNWQVGDRKSICKDNWGFEGLNGESLYVIASTIFEEKDFMRDCPRYGTSTKTLVHSLKGCPIARAILTLGGLDGRILTKDYLYCIDWIEYVMRILYKKAGADFITTLWNS